MSDVMDRLHEEHRNIGRILTALEHQLAVFERGDRPDYDVLSAIAAYFIGFPDRCHHPKEDLVYDAMRARDPAAAIALEGLEAEHGAVSGQARHFEEAVRNVLADAEVPRETFAAIARDFLETQRRHMQEEEAHFFPRAEETLDAEDWTRIDAAIADEADPVFAAAAGADDEFAALRDDILRWEAEGDRGPG